MESMRRRLANLEEAYADVVAPEGAEEKIRSEVFSRMSVPEKRAYAAALRRALQAEGMFSEEDRPILERVAVLRKEARDELEASA